MRALRTALICLLCLLCLPWLTGCQTGSSRPLRIGTNLWPGYEPLYLARDRFDWAAADIRLVEYPAASDVIRAFRNHALEAAALTLDEVLRLLEDEIPVQVVLVLDISEGADAILARPGIERIQDLAGRTVAVESNAVGAFVLSRALELHGMDRNSLRLLPATVDRHEQLFASGEADAVVTFEPVRGRLLAAGAREIFSSRDLPGEVVDVLVVHRDFLQADGRRVERLVQEWFAVVGEMAHNPGSQEELIGRRLKLSPAAVRQSFAGLALGDPGHNRRLLAGGTPPLADSLRHHAAAMVAQGLLGSPPAVEGVISSRFIPVAH